MFYISIAFTLFALLGGMHLLAKTQKEMLGKFFSWISYLIITLSILLVICQCTRGIMRMACRHRMGSENYMGGRMHCNMKSGCCMYGDKGCGDMEECKSKGDKDCCKSDKKHCSDMEEEEHEGEKPDSAKK